MSPKKKEEIRKEILKKRDALRPEEIITKSRLITEKLLASPVFAQARTIHVYRATATEVQTDAMIETALSLGKRVAVPTVFGDCLRLFEIHDLAPKQFQIGPFGIREPLARQSEMAKGEVDLWIIPGVAYDTRGRRIGRGRGYYDRLLADRVAPVISPAFEFQICDSIPLDPADQWVDQIITEERVIRCNGEIEYDHRWKGAGGEDEGLHSTGGGHSSHKTRPCSNPSRG